ncbi:unnamed protein product [Dicrocoelium dendriticum]|nr:unnamed protein product [Dicrocoelium dendriticum]
MMNYQQPFETTVGSNANSLFAPSSTGGGYTSDRVSTAHTSETKLPTSDSEAQWSRPPVNPSAVSPEYSHGYGLYHDGEKNLQSTPNPLLNVHRTVAQHVAPNPPLSLASTPHVTHRLPVSHDPISVSTDPQLTPVSGFSVVSVDKITLDKPDTAPQSIYSGAVRPRTSPRTATNVSQAKMPVRSTGLEQSKTQPKKSSRLHHTTSTTPHNQSLTTENLLAEPPGSGLDYMSYYYQYYYGANAVPFWPPHAYPVGDPTGRTTPKLFPTPHIKALLSSPGLLVQVLPNRPMDGELARVELVDLSDLAAQAVAEATKRLSDTGNASTNLTRLTELSLCRDAENLHDGFSSGASGVDSPGRLSSVQVVGGGDDEAEEARACTAIAMAWDRTDHLLYPGPLSRSETLKADVLAFLREKLAEIQDRLPIDWESAGLLIAYLESMVKNNGVSTLSSRIVIVKPFSVTLELVGVNV